MEGVKGVDQKVASNEVLVPISDFELEETSRRDHQSRGPNGLTILESGSPSFSKNSPTGSPTLGMPELESHKPRAQVSTVASSSSSPEITTPVPSPNKPPMIPEKPVIQRRSITRSAYSKPKSRLVEPFYPSDLHLFDERNQVVHSGSSYCNLRHTASSISQANVSAHKSVRTAPITPKTPLMATPGGEEDGDEDVYKATNHEYKSGKKLSAMVLVEWIIFICIMGFLIASLTIHNWKHHTFWGLEFWKWCVLALVIFCGRLFTGWFTDVLVFLIERNFLLKKKVLYFVHGLKNSVRVLMWLSLILLAWSLLINRGVRRSRKTARILNYITRALASSLIGAGIWMVKTLLIKIIASTFHVKRFFDRIQESLFHQYVLQTLSGPALLEREETVGSTSRSGQLNLRSMKKGTKLENDDVINIEKLFKMKKESISAWTMRGLIKVIQSSGLSTISNALDESAGDEEIGPKDEEITNEREAIAAAYRIFENVARPGNKYIDEEDLLRFMKKEEVRNVLPMFAGAAETGKIKKSSLRKWVVNVYNERKSLAHSLSDAKTAIEELNRILSGILLIAIIIVWLLLMGFITTHVLVFISSQLLLAAFIFGNTCRTIFEAIIFVFVMHPFDVGDRCVIDGVQMVVEEMNILTTIFLRYDNEKIYYPNSVLATKPISNFYRSPEMCDSVEFAVDVSTSVESIVALKAKIKGYLESKPRYWRPNHSVQVQEIEDVNKMKLSLYVNHTINFQNYMEKSTRRSELVLELKKIFEELQIKYNLLPLEVHLRSVASAVPTVASAPR